MNLKNFKIKDLLNTYLTTEEDFKEETTTVDIALPPDKASGDTKAGKANKKKKKKEKLILGKDGEPKKGKSG